MAKAQWIPERADAPGLAMVALFGAVAVALVHALPASPLVSDILLALGLGALVVNTPLRRLVGLSPPSFEREPDRWAAGLRFAGKWVLRLSIILMGLKVQTHTFGARELHRSRASGGLIGHRCCAASSSSTCCDAPAAAAACA